MEKFNLLRQLFSDNRAEWPLDDFKSIFVAPTYLHKLESVRPCILVGGRGTGKTTALQSLKYDASLERLEKEGLTFGDLEYLGVHIRMNKNRVRAFRGGVRSDSEWEKIFAHYFNLLVCFELCKMTIWLETRTGKTLSSSDLTLISSDLGLEFSETSEVLKNNIQIGISKLQIYVNNTDTKSSINFSISESPLRIFSECLEASGLIDHKTIFCCIDEYENLLDYQQALINTYIKHSEPPLSYKVGVRKNGLRNRQTLDKQDLLKTPDDYAEIEIADEGFEYFAREVAQRRLTYAKNNGVPVPASFSDFLGKLSFSEEAELLGSDKIAKVVLAELKEMDDSIFNYFHQKKSSEVCFLRYWQEKEKKPLIEVARDWFENETVWSTRMGNHGYSSLFWLSNGNKGIRIKKYYCGEKTLLTLPSGNIRYFLELIDCSIGYELESSRGKEDLIISPKSQTLAARDVGKRRLDQLEGLADNGVQLKRLVLGIGKVFFEYARSPLGKTPEMTSFIISGSDFNKARIKELIDEGIGHLAFEVEPKTKATTEFELKDEEYRLHRIFCAFFEMSHRKKRRVTFDALQLLNILEDKPSRAIKSLLGNDSNISSEDDLPEQLAFFSAFYSEERE